MATIGNTFKKENTETRDAFFTKSEKEHFEELLKDSAEKEKHEQFLLKGIDKLRAKAEELISRVDAGEFNEEQMQKVENTIAHCLAAVEDLERVLDLGKDLSL